ASHSTCKKSKTKSCACEGVPDPLIGHNKPRNNPLHHLSGMSLPWPLHGVFARQNEYKGLQWGMHPASTPLLRYTLPWLYISRRLQNSLYFDLAYYLDGHNLGSAVSDR
ncbi:hypothetical protein BO83DRAFT_272312, partial [Aspergillus eucalypticola CBS 122712]